MTLDEAIIHAENVASRKAREANRCFRHGGSAYEECGESLRECAAEHRQLAEWLKELKTYRETYPYGVEGYPPRAEPNSSEKPNNSTISKMEQVDEPQTCKTCKWGEWYRKGYDITMMDDECGGCCSWNSKWKPKDEPQTYVINPQEPTNDDKCFECDDFFICGGQCNKIEDEPQTPMCETCRYDEPNNPKCDECIVGEDKPSNYEPQTDCPWR